MINRIRDALADHLCRFLTGSTIAEVEWDQTHLQEALEALKNLAREKTPRSRDGSVAKPETKEEIAAVYVLEEHGLADHRWSHGRMQWARFTEEE